MCCCCGSVLLLNIQVFWDVTLCNSVTASKDHTAFTSKVKQSQNTMKIKERHYIHSKHNKLHSQWHCVTSQTTCPLSTASTETGKTV